jgi:small subunit ribosomal protein S20
MGALGAAPRLLQFHADLPGVVEAQFQQGRVLVEVGGEFRGGQTGLEPLAFEFRQRERAARARLFSGKRRDATTPRNRRNPPLTSTGHSLGCAPLKRENTMPNTKSAARRMRNSARKQARNAIVRTQLKTSEKKFRTALATPASSADALRAAISQLDKAVKKGVIKRGTADRKKSRLSLALNRATAAAKK